MALYLSLSQDRFKRHDFGMVVTARVWEDSARRVPHDLSAYERLRFRVYDREGGASKPIDGDAARSEDETNACTYTIGELDLATDGMYFADIEMTATGKRFTTVTEEFLVEDAPP